MRREAVAIKRFDRVTRVLHWVNAALFGTLMLTGAVLYAGPLSELVGRREVVRTVHVWSGLVLPVVVLVAVAPRWGRALRSDLRRLERWSTADGRWLRSFGTVARADVGKFNAGQKLNAAFVVGAGLVMLGTGGIMHWFAPFPVDWRTGATFVHDWVALAIWVVVLGHITFALKDPEALGGMARGTVPDVWAAIHAPRWLEEVEAGARTDAGPDSTGEPEGSLT